MSYHNLQEVLDEIHDGLLVKGMVPTALMDFVDESNIDSVIAGLPTDYRSFALNWAREVAFAPESELIRIAGISNLDAVHSDDKQHVRQAIFFRALRGWFERHTWPDLEQCLSNHRRWMRSLGSEGERLSIEGADLRGMDWSGQELGEIWLRGAQLAGCRLVRTDLYRCILTGACLDHADLTEAVLVKANLDHVRAIEACLRGARLLCASLDGADLRRAKLRDVDATAADFSDVDLRGADLRGSNLERVNLTGARLAGALLSRVVGLDSSVVEWIDVGVEESQQLQGDAATAWLRRCATALEAP